VFCSNTFAAGPKVVMHRAASASTSLNLATPRCYGHPTHEVSSAMSLTTMLQAHNPSSLCTKTAHVITRCSVVCYQLPAQYIAQITVRGIVVANIHCLHFCGLCSGYCSISKGDRITPGRTTTARHACGSCPCRASRRALLKAETQHNAKAKPSASGVL